MRFFSSKIGLVKQIYFVKTIPNFQVGGSTHATPRPLTIRVVYEVNHSWYGYHFGRQGVYKRRLYTMRTFENVTNNLSYRGHVCCAKRFFTLGTICGTNTKSLFAMSTMFATHASTQICSEVKNF